MAPAESGKRAKSLFGRDELAPMLDRKGGQICVASPLQAYVGTLDEIVMIAQWRAPG